MTEKDDLRIQAAKALGWHSFGYRAEDTEQERELIGVSPNHMLEIVPNPLDNPDHCEALLVATTNRGWVIISGGSKRAGEGTTYYSGFSHDDRRAYPHGFSDNPDPRAAYREAVTRACVAAYEAEIHASTESVIRG